jgi:hypothetical protein
MYRNIKCSITQFTAVVSKLVPFLINNSIQSRLISYRKLLPHFHLSDLSKIYEVMNRNLTTRLQANPVTGSGGL